MLANCCVSEYSHSKYNIWHLELLHANPCPQVTRICPKRCCTKSFLSSFNMNARIALCMKVVWRKMGKGLPNEHEWGSFYVQFPSQLEGPCHIIQPWISSTIPAVIIPMSCVHLHMYIIQAIFLRCNVGYAPWWYNTGKSSTIQKQLKGYLAHITCLHFCVTLISGKIKGINLFFPGVSSKIIGVFHDLYFLPSTSFCSAIGVNR